MYSRGIEKVRKPSVYAGFRTFNIYSTSVVFKTNSFSGEICNDPDETNDHQYFRKDNLPDEINEFDRKFIEIWLKDSDSVTIYTANGNER